MDTITFLLPGLLGTYPGVAAADRPALPGIEKILSRGNTSHFQGRSYYEDLWEHFNLDKSETQDLPVAPVTRLVDGVDPPEGIWVRADPVHLAAGRSGLVMSPPSKLQLTQHDAIILAATLEDLFTERGWSLEVPITNRWYLKLPELPAIRTTEIDYVVGKEIQPYMPEGTDRNKWLSLMNEVQMLLHDCEINLQREGRGELPVNSLWFWGIGVMPDIIQRQWSVIYTDDPVARGMAMLSGTRCPELPGDISVMIGDPGVRGDVLIASTRLLSFTPDDLEGWLAAITDLERAWFTPACDAAAAGQLKSVTIDTGDYQVLFDRRSSRRFWRFRKSVVNYR